MSFQNISDPASAPQRLRDGVPVDLDGRFMLPGREEFPCRIIEMSIWAIAFYTPIRPELGDRIIAYISEFGRFEGFVERRIDCGFAISLRLTEMKQRKLAAQLLWRANRDKFGLEDGRRNDRIVPLVQWTRIRTPNGREKMARINDVSRAGVSVETAAEVMVGDRVFFGSKTAVVGRVFESGFVAEFDEPLSENELTETIRL
jgi:hypothetical protein